MNNELQSAGLSKNQVDVYTLLVSLGPSTGLSITKGLTITRQLVYKVLDELEELGLVEKTNKEGAVTKFSAKHPSLILDALKEKRSHIDSTIGSLTPTIDRLACTYNLVAGRPTIKFMEGLRGVHEILDDTLTSNETIYTYVDTDSLNKFVGPINTSYVKKRVDKHVKKKILMLDSELARQKVAESADDTEIRLLQNTDAAHFNATMNIYDGKLAYFTYTSDGLLTATLIHDRNIYLLHRKIFESLWEKSSTDSHK